MNSRRSLRKKPAETSDEEDDIVERPSPRGSQEDPSSSHQVLQNLKELRQLKRKLPGIEATSLLQVTSERSQGLSDPWKRSFTTHANPIDTEKHMLHYIEAGLRNKENPRGKTDASGPPSKPTTHPVASVDLFVVKEVNLAGLDEPDVKEK